MVGELVSREALDIAIIDFREHRRVPGAPFFIHSIVNVSAQLLEIGALHRIIGEVEQERIVFDLEKFEVAIAHGPLGIGLVSPKQFARHDRSASGQQREEVYAIWRKPGIDA